MLAKGNFIDFGDNVINIDFITNIEKVKHTDYNGDIITWWRVRTTEYGDYTDLNQEQYDFLIELIKKLSNSYTVY